MYPFYESPRTLDDALGLKARHGNAARFVAGATDLLLEVERGGRTTSDGAAPGLIDLSRISGLAEISARAGWIHLGPLVTHNLCVGSALLVENAFPLVRACWEVGAPQIRNRATVAGNVITASPANDTIPSLLALDAQVTLRSQARGERTLPLRAFLTGFRSVDMADDEMLVDIAFPMLGARAAGTFIKLGLRKAQAISVVTVAVVIHRTHTGPDSTVERAAIALGCVAPTVIRAPDAEEFLVGKTLDAATIAEAARLAMRASAPIDDIRAGAEYRRAMVETLTARALDQLATGRERLGWPADPILLQGESGGAWPVGAHSAAEAPATVNGAPCALDGHQSLLDSLRAAGFTGVKEGCAEGECGACTVFLDGMAVMACMVPAERAAGSSVVTIEGLARDEALHPMQAAIAEAGGVQCGYCTPGFVMSAAKLLEERPHPTHAEAQEAFTGNFCRCTGYRKIVEAAVMAGAQGEAAS